MRFSCLGFTHRESAASNRRNRSPRRKRLHLAVQALEARRPLAASQPINDGGMQFVIVDDAGNAADTTGNGAVSYEYRIGKFEVTIGQYAKFLNAVAKTDTYGLYHEGMGTDLNIAGISRFGSQGSYTYTVMNNGGDSSNRPVTYASFGSMVRFANWMHNGQPTGLQDATTTEDGAYSYRVDSATWGRKEGARFYLPTRDEWYKAAFYKGGGVDAGYWRYATQADGFPGNTIGGEVNQANYFPIPYYSTLPPGSFATGGEYYDSGKNYLTDVGAFTNGASYYGTFDQSGNVFERLEDGDFSGGSWLRQEEYLSSDLTPIDWLLYIAWSGREQNGEVGFRLASPAPKNLVVDADGHPLNGVRIDVIRGGSTLTTVYSDYDGTSTVLDADGITGDFDLEGIAAPAPGQTTTVVVTAKDLNAKTYTRTIDVQASQFSRKKILLGTVKFDGLDTPVGPATSTSTGGAYRRVDAKGLIHLHDDQRNDDADHVIKRREATSPLVKSDRYKAEVEVVTTKLASLGFRETNGTGDGSNAPPLEPTAVWATTSSPTGAWMPASERALLLFQTLWQRQGESGVFKAAIEGGIRTVVSGEVAVKDRNNRNTLAHLNAAKGVIWSLNVGRTSFPGAPNSNNDFLYRSNNNRWMHASAVRALADLDRALDGLTGNLAISVRQITSNSPAAGGNRRGVTGATHHAGGEIDVPWVTRIGTAGSGNFYRGLKNTSGKEQPVPLAGGGNPLAAQEWTRTERAAAINALRPKVKQANPTWTEAEVEAEAARLAEVKAYDNGKRWIVVDSYDRARTKAYIEKIFALNATVANRVRHLYFNDPALLPGGSSAITPPAGVTFIPIPGHGNHVHFSINFDKKDSLPARVRSTSPTIPGAIDAPAWAPPRMSASSAIGAAS